MTPRQATRFMYWFGEKCDYGDTPTEEEIELFAQAKAASLAVVKKYMRLEPKDWKYIPGKPFV